MSTKMYEKYAVLDSQIKELTRQKDELKVEIVQEIAKTRDNTVETVVGKFTIAALKTWKYTPKVTEFEEMLKAQKATEQSTGDATYEEKPSLRFTQIKL